jgi:hypothetical protein
MVPASDDILVHEMLHSFLILSINFAEAITEFIGILNKERGQNGRVVKASGL